MRTEVIGMCTLHLGDCMEMAGSIAADSVISDPPYGMRNNTASRRFTGGHNPVKRRDAEWGDRLIIGDSSPFDPLPWLGYRDVILWGANHFARHLPVGSTLIWIKRNEPAFGAFLSDGEIAWKKGGHGVYCFKDLSMNSYNNPRRPRLHPNQKPIPLMRWCVEKTSGVVLDPYMGSGSTAVACIELGRPFVGIEIDERFFDAACRRIEAATAAAPECAASPAAAPSDTRPPSAAAPADPRP